MEIKVCSKCKEEKSLDNFRFRKDSKDKLAYWCNSCLSNINKELRKNHYEKYKEIEKNSRIKNINNRKIYYLINKDKNKERCKAWRCNNKEKERENLTRFHINNPDWKKNYDKKGEKTHYIN